MGRDDSYFDKVEWLDDGTESEPSDGDAPPRLPWPRWFTLTVAALVVAGAVGTVNHLRTSPSAQPAATAASPSAPRLSLPATTPSPPTSVTTTRLGHPLFGASTGWELIGRGPGVLVRIQPAAGRIVRTAIPDLRSGGPVFLLSGPDRVIVRPLDNVPGYLVPDGKSARELPVQLNLSGPVFPGPVPGQMWVRPADDHQPVMALATLDGRRLPGFIQVPSGSSAFEAVADGAGYLLYPGIGGVYQARPDGTRRISTGALQAVGPTGWLVVECDEHYRCQTVRINRADGSRETVADVPVSSYSRGVISPDGSTAAVLTNGPGGIGRLYLLNFARGSWLRADLDVIENFDGAIAFSPDSRLLFAVRTDGTVAVVDSQTSTVSILDEPLPPVSQLVVRPASLGGVSLSAVDQALTRTCCRPVPRQ